MKVPEPIPVASRNASRERFTAEVARGGELNDIALAIAETGEAWSFALPKFHRAGTIVSVSLDGSEDGYDNGHVFCGLPFILYEWVESHQLDTLLTSDDPLLMGYADTIRNNWFEFAEGLARVVARLHNHGFLHAYIVPRNILFDMSGVTPKCYLAGFGYSSLSIEESSSPDKTVKLDAPYQAAEFKKRRQLDALWHPCDIYSVGAVLLYLATKRPPVEHGWENADTLKTEVRRAIEVAEQQADGSRQETLLKALRNHNVAKIIDNCLRHNPDDRFATAEELLEAIDIAKTEPVQSTESTTLGPYFSAVLTRRQAALAQFTDRLNKRHHYELYGSRTAIVEGLCRLLAGLDRGAIYRTVTLPSYWTAKNLGPDGRFLAMNKHVARRGVTIERIFLVSGPFHTLSEEEQAILERQIEASSTQRDYFDVKVHLTDRALVQGFERQGKSVAFVASGSDSFEVLAEAQRAKRSLDTGQFLCLNFISRGESKVRYGKEVIEREIRKVRIWDPARGTVYVDKLHQEVEDFNRYLRDAATVSLRHYMAESSTLTLEELLRRKDLSISGQGPV